MTALKLQQVLELIGFDRNGGMATFAYQPRVTDEITVRLNGRHWNEAGRPTRVIVTVEKHS